MYRPGKPRLLTPLTGTVFLALETAKGTELTIHIESERGVASAEEARAWTRARNTSEIERIVPDQSFSVELPPYSQDLSDFGKGPSDGWSFTNSFCSERYVGGIERGRPPFEAGCSQKDTDFLHIINWKKAA